MSSRLCRRLQIEPLLDLVSRNAGSSRISFPPLGWPEGHHFGNPMFGYVGRLKRVCSASVHSLLRPDLLSYFLGEHLPFPVCAYLV